MISVQLIGLSSMNGSRVNASEQPARKGSVLAGRQAAERAAAFPNALILLPDSGDWEMRYGTALRLLGQGDGERQRLEDRYRLWQRGFEAGILPASSSAQGVQNSKGGSAGGVRSTEEGEEEPDLEQLFCWTNLQQSNLGMSGLSRHIDVSVAARVEDWDSLGALGGITSSIEAVNDMVAAKENAAFSYAQAESYLNDLLKEFDQDAVAWSLRGQVRRGWAMLIRLGLLPLHEQPIAYAPAMRYRVLTENAIADLNRAIVLWSQTFPDVDQSSEELVHDTDSATAYYIRNRPIGTASQRMIIVHYLYQCCMMRYGLLKAERRYGEAVADLSRAIALKPQPALFLDRAKLYFRLGSLNAAVTDCLESLQRVASHIPTSQRSDFEALLSNLKMEAQVLSVGTIIRATNQFWQANPMLLLSG